MPATAHNSIPARTANKNLAGFAGCISTVDNLHTLVAVPLYHKMTSRDQAPVLSWWLSLLYAASKHETWQILGRGIQLICTIKQAFRDSKSKKPPQDELTALIDTNGSISQRYSTTRSIQPTGTDLEVL